MQTTKSSWRISTNCMSYCFKTYPYKKIRTIFNDTIEAHTLTHVGCRKRRIFQIQSENARERQEQYSNMLSYFFARDSYGYLFGFYPLASKIKNSTLERRFGRCLAPSVLSSQQRRTTLSPTHKDGRLLHTALIPRASL